MLTTCRSMQGCSVTSHEPLIRACAFSIDLLALAQHGIAPLCFQELPFSETIDVGTAAHQTSLTRCESCQTWNTSPPRPRHLWVGWIDQQCPGTFFLAFHLLDHISPEQWWHRPGKKFLGWALTHRQQSLISCLSFDEPARISWQNLTRGDHPSLSHV